MADSPSDSQIQSSKSDLTRINRSFINIPGFFIGFGSRRLVESDSVTSPTSPLDFSFFSSLNNAFGHKSPTLSSLICHQKKWESSKLGLGVINLLVDETKPISDDIESLERKNILFGSQVKSCSSLRSNSLPKNFMMSLSCKTKTPCSQLHKSNDCNVIEEFVLKPNDDFSTINLTPTTNLSSSESCPQYRTTPAESLPLLIDTSSQMDNSLDVKWRSLPIPIEIGHANVGSLSAREIQLSEDYTCITCHGPNPKTTHIFCDCILECQADDLFNSKRIEILECQLPPGAKRPEVSAPNSSDQIFSIRCKKSPEMGDDLDTYASEKAFCSFDCCSADVFSEEEAENNHDTLCKSSPSSSYNEDLFLVGMPMVT